ncbi:MAG: MoxR family ATPase [Pseudomonadota bacterium]|nr:MoxR family ATPase [Pseudomonadota bacterium]
MSNEKSLSQKITDASVKLQNIKKQISQVILGQERVIDLTLTCIASSGHVILLGVPGLAKTKLVETIGKTISLDTGRIQCTPDLMPADIIGSEILDEDADGKRHFKFIKGPVFAQLLMADEINRASPRTQSALLQAMQEHQVTIAGQTYDLPKPFYVLATQNPLEQEGTYPLPEEQLDRFMMEVQIDYPDLDAERAMVLATTTNSASDIKAIASPDDLIDIQKLVQELPLPESVLESIINLVRNARPETSSLDNVKNYIVWAPGPRATQALSLSVRAHALIHGREIATNEDIRALAHPILRHRMSINARALSDGISIDDIITQLITEFC